MSLKYYWKHVRLYWFIILNVYWVHRLYTVYMRPLYIIINLQLCIQPGMVSHRVLAFQVYFLILDFCKITFLITFRFIESCFFQTYKGERVKEKDKIEKKNILGWNNTAITLHLFCHIIDCKQITWCSNYLVTVETNTHQRDNVVI